MTRFRTTDHPRIYPGFTYVYPVWSRRRRGISLGINLNPDKVCNFHCVYCQVDRFVPGHESDVDAEAVREELERVLQLAAEGRLTELPGFDWLEEARQKDDSLPDLALKDVSFSGDGEPTTARSFPQLVGEVFELLESYKLSIPVIVFTNATRVDRAPVRAALTTVMERGGAVWAKLDAGTDEGLLRYAGLRMPMKRILKNLTMLATPGPLTIQTLLCRDAEGPTPLDEVRAMGERLAEIAAAGGRIHEVQLTTVARPTPDAQVEALRPQELEERRSILAESQPFPVTVYV
ncbi:MAG: radical SAM protein [Myxococcales bacterium]|nr:radical SAM protein [Myxococcales bacterium]